MPQIDFNMFLPTAYWYSLSFLILALTFYLFYLVPYTALSKILGSFQIFVFTTTSGDMAIKSLNNQHFIRINFSELHLPITLKKF